MCTLPSFKNVFNKVPVQELYRYMKGDTCRNKIRFSNLLRDNLMLNTIILISPKLGNSPNKYPCRETMGCTAPPTTGSHIYKHLLSVTNIDNIQSPV